MQHHELTRQQLKSISRQMILRAAVIAVLSGVSVAITTAIARTLGFGVAGVWTFVLYWSSFKWVEPALTYEFDSAWNYLMLIVTSLVAAALSGFVYVALGLLINMTANTSLIAFYWRDYETSAEAFLRVSLITIWPLIFIQPVLLTLRWFVRRRR